MNLLLFLIKMIIVSGILLAYYWCFLRDKKFHHYNRFYLLSIPAIAICLPLVSIPIEFYLRNQNAAIRLLKVVTTSSWEQAVIIMPQSNYWSQLIELGKILAHWAIFMTVVLILLISLY